MKTINTKKFILTLLLIIVPYASHARLTREDAIKFQVPHLILKTINCVSAICSTSQDYSLKGRKRSNNFKFLETLTDVPSYYLKQQLTTI